MKKSSVILLAVFVCIAGFLSSCSVGCPGNWRGNTVNPKAFRPKSAYKIPAPEQSTLIKHK